MRAFTLFTSLLAGLLGGPAFAELTPVDAYRLGFASPQGLLFGETASEEMVALVGVAMPIMYVMIAICAFVLLLLFWVAIRFNKRANPVPSTTTHSTLLEVLWTGIPAIIVIAIGFVGVRQVLAFERQPALGMIEANGYMNSDDTILDINVYGMPSWNWEYELVYFGDAAFAAEHPEFYATDLGAGVLADGFRFTSNMLEHPDREKRSRVPARDRPALLAVWDQLGRHEDFYQFDVDNRLVIPSGVRVNVNVQGPLDTDKQHAWAVPAFGVKRDFWPGRVNSAHFLVPEGGEGLYFGQCSEFCGSYHAYMPIAVHVVTLDEFRTYFASEMAAAVAALENGGLFAPEYLPVNLPAPYNGAVRN